jgi:hypothetical protein
VLALGTLFLEKPFSSSELEAKMQLTIDSAAAFHKA